MTETTPSNATAILKAGQEIGDPRFANQEDADSVYAVVPRDSKIGSLEHLLVSPRRKRGCPTFLHESGFDAYVKDHMDDGSRIFADATKQTMCAVLDMHWPNGQGGDAQDAARWGDHRAIFAPPKDPDWLAWIGAHDRKMGQLQFAQFIEDMLPTIDKPDGAELLEVAQHLEATTDVTFKSATRLQDGNREFVYEEQVKGKVGKGQIEIPAEFTLKLPVFLRGARHELRAKLRYRISDEGLVMWVHLHRHEEVLLTAFEKLMEGVNVETGLRPMMGCAPDIGSAC